MSDLQAELNELRINIENMASHTEDEWRASGLEAVATMLRMWFLEAGPEMKQRARKAETALNEANKEIERLREALEPGKAAAIITAMFSEAERLGHSRVSSKHALSFFVEYTEEANKLLEQTIEVLGGVVQQTHSNNDYRCPICGGTWDYPDEHHTEQCPYPKAKPLLDNLKALKKEGTE